MKNRDFRGLIHDIYHNVPLELQRYFLSRIELLGDDIKQVVRSCSSKYNWQT
jgi:hypothetical protein